MEDTGIQDALKQLYSSDNIKPPNKIQDALFYTPEVLNYLEEIQTGDDAIQFFAKYGNSTPIKYVNAVRKETSKEIFRPYDLDVLPMKDGDITLHEYFTISAHGIVHVFSNKYRKLFENKMSKEAESGDNIFGDRPQKMNDNVSTEFVSLSEWMHESTMFNIITKLPFFKNFITGMYRWIVFRGFRGYYRDKLNFLVFIS